MSKGILVKSAGTLHPLSLIDRLAKDFLEEDFILAANYKNLDTLLSRMNTLSKHPSAKRQVYTIFPGGDCCFIVSLKENSRYFKAAFESNNPDLDILRELIFKETLGLNIQDEENFVLTDDIANALQLVDQEEYQYLFILN